MNMKALLLPSLFPFPPSISFDSRRRRFPGTRATVGRKRANLFARKNKRVKLPEYADGHGRALSISEFLHHPSSVKALLNTRALDGFESLGSSTYRCFLQKIQLLMLEVAPVLELRVIPTREDCTVEMLSCKFEGSEYMKRQNDLFSGVYTTIQLASNISSRETWQFVISLGKIKVNRQRSSSYTSAQAS